MEKRDSSDTNGERDPLTGKIIEACYHVHTELGPGFVERIYMNALKIALEKRKLKFTAETEFVVRYDEQPIGKFRADLLVENHGNPKANCGVLYPPLCGIVQLTNFPTLRYGNWSFTIK